MRECRRGSLRTGPRWAKKHPGCRFVWLPTASHVRTTPALQRLLYFLMHLPPHSFVCAFHLPPASPPTVWTVQAAAQRLWEPEEAQACSEAGHPGQGAQPGRRRVQQPRWASRTDSSALLRLDGITP
jgi:hypothetical protein